MLFFPYRADIEQWRFPLITLLICALSAIVLANQFAQKSALQLSAVKTCYLSPGRDLATAAAYVAERVELFPEKMCTAMLVSAHLAEDPENTIRRWAFASRSAMSEQEIERRDYIDSVFQKAYARFSIEAPMPLTENLWFEPKPGDISVLKMLTSIFAHGDIEHLVMNLFFFFAFAATVEMIIGSLSMLATVTLLALLTNTFYTVIGALEGAALPTLGLSGVVFGMMGMFACFLPGTRIKCFAWLVFMFWRPQIPAWLLVGGFLLWNVYSWLLVDGSSNINFIVHISGALFGYLIALLIFRSSLREYAKASTVRNSRQYLHARH